jgi:DNA-binding GntR family transcriptional regulator
MIEENPSSAVVIRRAIEDEVMQGRLLPGQRIDEKSLAEKFAMSRTPVREALQRLAASGLIKLRGRQGAIVSELTIPDLLDAFQLVAELEGMCARLAARRMTRDQQKAMRALHEECVAQVGEDDPHAFYDANNRFHEIIYDGSHNRFLQEEIRRLRLIVAPYRRYITFQPGRMRESLDEHAAVIEAILRNDDAAADDKMCAHVSLLGDRFTDFVSVLRSNGISSTAAAE